MGLMATIGIQAVIAGPALTPFNFKVKECRVDTNPEPISCKDLKKLISDQTFVMEVERSPHTPGALLFHFQSDPVS
jgi:hypothetical protein